MSTAGICFALFVALFGIDADRQQLRDADAMAASGDARAAVDSLVELADRAPNGELADDALSRAARIAEQRLVDPELAVKLYRRLLADHPDSRYARRAATRMEELERSMGAGGEYAAELAEFERLRSADSGQSVAESIAAMDALVRDHPDFPRRGDAEMWIAGAYRREGQLDEALAAYRRVQRDTAGPQQLEARHQEGRVLLSRGDVDGAEQIFASLVEVDDVGIRAAAHASLDDVARERSRRRLAWLAWAVLAAFALAMVLLARSSTGSWPAALRRLARPPIEVIYLAPILALFAVISETSNTIVARAVTLICVGATAVTWLSGAVLLAAAGRGPIRWPRAAFHAVVAALAVAAVCYLALTEQRVLDLVMETVAYGPE